jgi:magnesium chelatase subunit D
MKLPFSALVGQEPLKTALLLNAIDPAIGGVLIRGEKGTAKSTAARSLAALLPPLRVVAGCPYRCAPDAPWPECPHCATATDRRDAEMPVPFVELPLGATEDRVLGTLDFERALRDGQRVFEPGLLAAAHRGILYIDEVNLLPDHLVDVLLDAAAMGVNTVQREGVSLSHPARFFLIGTMNPEEGDLRPQLLDRFGLLVEVVGPREPAVRAEIARRCLDFASNPAAFAECWSAAQRALAARVIAARERLREVLLSDDLATFIAQLCCELDVDGMRADLALHRAARAHAALRGVKEANMEDVRAAAELVLPHRRRRRPFEQPRLDRQKLDEHFSATSVQPPESPDNGTGECTDEAKDGGVAEQVMDGRPVNTPRRMEVTQRTDAPPPDGRRNAAPATRRGHFVRSVADPHATDIALGATIRSAARRGPSENGRVEVTATDLHQKMRDGRTRTLLLFVVDASGSMAARRRMELVKSTVLGLLRSAYEQRDEVAVIAFRGLQADVLLPPTRSVAQAEQALRTLPTGGRTPLAHALVTAETVIRQARRGNSERPVLLILLSDGRANVPLPGSGDDAWQQAVQAARAFAATGVPALVLDSDAGFVRLGRAPQLAEALSATCLPLEEMSAETLVLKLRQTRGG